MLLRVFSGLIAGCLPLAGLAQSDSLFTPDDAMIVFTEASVTDPDPEEVLEVMEGSEKINLNHTSQKELEKIPFLTGSQIRNLLSYRDRYGHIYSVNEIHAIEGFDSVTIRQMMPLVIAGASPPAIRLTPGNLLRKGHHDLVVRILQPFQRQAGYTENDSLRAADPENYFLGDPQKYYFRYRYTFSDQVIVGISGEKDAGEQFFRGSGSAGMDFYSGFLCYRSGGWLQQLVLGNYRACYGQGLTVGGNSFGSRISFANSMTWASGSRPSQSVREYGYLQGISLTCRSGPVEYTSFVSRVRSDASGTGYHRTPTEIEQRHAIRELLYGGHVSVRGKFFLVGITGYRGSRSGEDPAAPAIYNRFSLPGNVFGAAGIDGRIRFLSSQFFGELSISMNGGLAGVAGLFSSPAPGCEVLFLYRHYGRNYRNPLSTALSQSQSPVNEEGCYLKVSLQPWSWFRFTGYADLFRFPWLKYRVDGPSSGWEAGAMGVYSDSRLSASLRYGFRQCQTGGTDPVRYTDSLTENRIGDLKLDLTWKVSAALSMNTLVEVRSGSIGGVRQPAGYVAGQDIRYRSPGLRWGTDGRFLLFDVPSYFSRIYAWEPRLPYSYSSSLCLGSGIRFVAQGNWQFNRHLGVWVWIGVTDYFDRDHIGSGLEEISGNIKAEMQLQVRIGL